MTHDINILLYFNSCQVNEGTPLAYKDTKKKSWTLVGMVTGSCPSSRSSRVTRVSAYKDWIGRAGGEEH